MKRFAALYEVLDRTTSPNDKVEAMTAWFAEAPAADAAWAVSFLTGQRLKLGRAPAGKRDGGALCVQGPGNGGTDAAGGAGNESNLAGQVEHGLAPRGS